MRASVKHYLSTDGTLWDSMPLKKELRDATFDMAFALVLILNQVLSHATASVHDVRTPACDACPCAAHLCCCARYQHAAAVYAHVGTQRWRLLQA